MSLLLFFFSTSLLLKLRAQSQHLCRVHGLKAQEAILKNLKKLFSLNPKALKLEIQNKKLKAKRVFYLATGNAVKVAHIQALLLKVYIKKRRLARQQKSLLLKARRDASLVLFQLKSSFGRKLRQGLGGASQGFLSITPKTLRWTGIPLAVRKNPLISVASTYHPQGDFVEKQRLPVFWAFDLHIYFLGYRKFWTVKGHCVASLQPSLKGGLSWIAHLREDLKGKRVQ